MMQIGKYDGKCITYTKLALFFTRNECIYSMWIFLLKINVINVLDVRNSLIVNTYRYTAHHVHVQYIGLQTDVVMAKITSIT